MFFFYIQLVDLFLSVFDRSVLPSRTPWKVHLRLAFLSWLPPLQSKRGVRITAYLCQNSCLFVELPVSERQKFWKSGCSRYIKHPFVAYLCCSECWQRALLWHTKEVEHVVARFSYLSLVVDMQSVKTNCHVKVLWCGTCFTECGYLRR